MAKKTVPERITTVDELYAGAEAQMQAAGVSTDELDPAVAILALSDKATVSTALIHDFDQELAAIRGSTYFGASGEPMRLDHSKARHLKEKRYDLARSSRRRTRLVGLALGAIAGASTLITLGSDRAAFDSASERSGWKTSLTGKPLLKDNTLIEDSSIMPGQVGHDTPVIGPIVRNIPGIPDFGGSKVTYTQETEEQVTEQQVTVQEGYTAERSQNPVSPDLSLTGVEYGQGRAAARRFLDQLTKDQTFKPAELIVTGKVSDEYNGQLGILDPRQAELAEARASVALQALQDEARERNVALPEKVTILPDEAVLSSLEIDEINGLAQGIGIGTPELIRMYNNGESLPQHVVDLLDQRLAVQRGAEFTALGTREVIEEVSTLKPVKQNSKRSFGDIPGEALFGLGALVPSAYGLAASTIGHRHKTVRRKARRIAKKAGLTL